MTAPILANLQRLYPLPQIDENWISSSLASLLASSPGLSLVRQIQQLHAALLESNLSVSTISRTGFPPGLGPTEEGVEPLHRVNCFVEPKRCCLVQIVSLTEIGASAGSLQRTLEERREAGSGRARIRPLEGEEMEEEADEDENGPKYSRGMLRMEVSDGHSVCKAIEYRRIDALRLGETQLGCKLVLKNVPVLQGILLLTPENCTVKGSRIPAFEDDGRGEAAFEAGLRERLGLVELLPAGPPGFVPADATDGKERAREDDEEEEYMPEGFAIMANDASPLPLRPPRPRPTPHPPDHRRPPSSPPRARPSKRNHSALQPKSKPAYVEIDSDDEMYRDDEIEAALAVEAAAATTGAQQAQARRRTAIAAPALLVMGKEQDVVEVITELQYSSDVEMYEPEEGNSLRKEQNTAATPNVNANGSLTSPVLEKRLALPASSSSAWPPSLSGTALNSRRQLPPPLPPSSVFLDKHKTAGNPWGSLISASPSVASGSSQTKIQQSPKSQLPHRSLPPPSSSGPSSTASSSTAPVAAGGGRERKKAPPTKDEEVIDISDSD